MNRKIQENLNDFYELYFKVERLNIDSSIRCLTISEMRIINCIGKTPLTVNELALKLELTIGTISLAISKLEKKQFITRKKDGIDKRKVYVKLTKKGEMAYDYHGDFNDTLFKNITKNVNKSELEQFLKVLRKMSSNLYVIKKEIEPIALYNFKKGDIVIIDEVHANEALLNYLIDKKLTIGKQVTIKEKYKNSMVLLVDSVEKTIIKEDCLCVYCIKKENK